MKILIGLDSDSESIWLSPAEDDPDEISSSSGQLFAEIPDEVYARVLDMEKAYGEAITAAAEAAGFDESMGRLVECCPSWVGEEGQDSPSWCSIIVPSERTEEDQTGWGELHIGYEPTEADAALFIAGMPERFWFHSGGRAGKWVDRAELVTRVSEGRRTSDSSCFRCGWYRDDHADRGHPIDD